MKPILSATRIIGGAIALCLLVLLCALLFESIHNVGFTLDFFWGQILPVYVPYFALLILLLLPFSRIRRSSVWVTLFAGIVLLLLVWLVPSVLRAISSPSVVVTVPPGDGVAPKILITHSYAELRSIGLILAFLLTQILAIWFTRPRPATLSDVA